jgi:hypothetical protein
LGGVDIIKLGYISRTSFKSSKAHQLLGTQAVKPKDFAAQMNLNMDNAWGIAKALLTFCFDNTEGSPEGMLYASCLMCEPLLNHQPELLMVLLLARICGDECKLWPSIHVSAIVLSTIVELGPYLQQYACRFTYIVRMIANHSMFLLMMMQDSIL